MIDINITWRRNFFEYPILERTYLTLECECQTAGFKDKPIKTNLNQQKPSTTTKTH